MDRAQVRATASFSSIYILGFQEGKKANKHVSFVSHCIYTNVITY